MQIKGSNPFSPLTFSVVSTLPPCSFRWQRALLGPRGGPLPLFLPPTPPPFRFGRRGWRLVRRPQGPKRVQPASLPFQKLPPLPSPLRPALLGLVRFRLELLREALPLIPRPLPLVLFPPPFRFRHRRKRIQRNALRQPLFPPVLLGQRILSFRRRRGIRRWLLPSLAALAHRPPRLSPFVVYGRRRRRVPRRLRPRVTLVVAHRIRSRLPLGSPLVGLSLTRCRPPRTRLGIRRPLPLHRICHPFPLRRRRRRFFSFHRFPRTFPPRRRRAPIG